MDIQYKACAPENYTRGRKEPVRYLVIHYTANDGDTARGNAAYFARENGGHTSAHYFVDEKEVWQSVKEGDTAHHCGAKSYRHPIAATITASVLNCAAGKGKGDMFFFPRRWSGPLCSPVRSWKNTAWGRNMCCVITM